MQVKLYALMVIDGLAHFLNQEEEPPRKMNSIYRNISIILVSIQ